MIGGPGKQAREPQAVLVSHIHTVTVNNQVCARSLWSLGFLLSSSKSHSFSNQIRGLSSWFWTLCWTLTCGSNFSPSPTPPGGSLSRDIFSFSMSFVISRVWVSTRPLALPMRLCVDLSFQPLIVEKLSC